MHILSHTLYYHTYTHMYIYICIFLGVWIRRGSRRFSCNARKAIDSSIDYFPVQIQVSYIYIHKYEKSFPPRECSIILFFSYFFFFLIISLLNSFLFRDTVTFFFFVYLLFPWFCPFPFLHVSSFPNVLSLLPTFPLTCWFCVIMNSLWSWRSRFVASQVTPPGERHTAPSCFCTVSSVHLYGVPTISRLLKIIGLFYRI